MTIDAKKIKIVMTANPERDKESTSEKGGIYRRWYGYLTYDNKPLMGVVGNHRLDPKDGKKQWISIQESISKQELEENDGLQGDEIGFASISPGLDKEGNPIETAYLPYANLISGNLFAPLQGKIIEKEIDEKIVYTLALRCDQKTIDFWETKLEDKEFLIVNPNIKEADLLQTLEALQEDYVGFETWYLKHFPKSSSFAKNAVKRKELLNSILSGKKETAKPVIKAASTTTKKPWDTL